MKNYFFGLFLLTLMVFATTTTVLACDSFPTEVQFVMGAQPALVTINPPDVGIEYTLIANYVSDQFKQIAPEKFERDALIRPGWQDQSASFSNEEKTKGSLTKNHIR